MFSAGYLGIMAVTFVAAFVLPEVATSDSPFVDDAIEGIGIAYLVGGLLFGIALYRASVLPRWAAALLRAARPARQGP